MGSMGGGGISQGVLIDEDFNNRDHDARTSRTRSDVDDTGLFYVNADLGFRALRWGAHEQPGFIDALGGYQYWHETYVAFGATSAFPAAVPTISSTAKVITQDYYWHSLRQGSAQRSEEHTSELQSQSNLVCRLLLEKKKSTASSDPSEEKLLQR